MVLQAATIRAPDSSEERRRKPWRVRTYVFLLAALLLVVQIGSGLYERHKTMHDAERTAAQTAAHLSNIAAALIGSDIEAARADVAKRAASPDGACSAIVGGPDGALGGRVEMVDRIGAKQCSSTPATQASTSAAPAVWLSQALAAPALIGPVAVPGTARLAAVISAPVADRSAAVLRIIDLDTFGAGLAATFGENGQFDVVIVDDVRVVSTSHDPVRWIGAPVNGTGFDAPEVGTWRDLGGVRRIFGRSAVRGTGWTVYVGADRERTVAQAAHSADGDLLLSLLLTALVLVAWFVVFRQVVRPISRLSALVRHATSVGTSEHLVAAGPLEVQALSTDFRALVRDRERELADTRRLGATNAAILDAAIDSIVTIDSNGLIVEFNPAAESAFGYRRADVLGRTMSEVIVPERLREGHRRGLAHYLATGEGTVLGNRVELVAMRSDGTEFPVELTVTRVDVPGSPLFTGYLRDLTSRFRARDELAASERRFQMILDNSPAIIHLKDLEGRYLFVNREGLRVIGRSRDEIIGRTDADLFPAELADLYRMDDLETIQGEVPRQRERPLLSAADGERTILSVKFPLIAADGAAYGVAGISTDITDSKRLDDERRFLQERLDQSQRLESLGRLAGGVAHDFNNLLAVILIHAKFVADRTEGQVHADVEQIRGAAERAAGLTRQLLVFGRRDRVNLQSIDLAELISGVLDVLARGIGPHIDLQVEASPDVPQVLADRGQMEQVLLNLAINARDAMPEGGTLSFIIESDGAHAETRASVPPMVRLTVSDTGTGMEPEVVARAFEPFFTTKPPGQGTGLGLATVYGIITEAGGTIDIASAPGTGTTFRIALPAADAAMAVAPEQIIAPVPTGGGQTILVVDDEPALLAVTVRILEEHGYDVISATSIDEALARADGESIHLLLSDFLMPKMSGTQLADHMRTERPDLHVLLMSGYDHALADYVPLGDQSLAVLRKPFSESELLTIVHEILAMA